jgi:4-amino-4-deoxy-L-arabinose transferase-like glycosyltransferase
LRFVYAGINYMRPLLFALLVALAAFALRLGFTIAFRGNLETVPTRDIAGADPAEYDALARSVASGKGYSFNGVAPTAFRAPGFPLFLAAVYALFGPDLTVPYIVFALCGALGVVATYLLARELIAERPAQWAAVFAALYPPDIYDTSFFYSEVLFVPCLGFGLWLVARAVRTQSLAAVAGAGLLLGSAALTRSFGVLFLPIFGLYLCFAWQRGWRAAVVFGIAFVAAIAPWTIRNYSAFGRPVLIATNGGSTFYGANNDLVAGTPREFGSWVSTTRLPGRDLIDAQPDEVSHDKMEWQLGIEWVKRNPHKFIALAPAKVARFWLPFIQYPSFKVYPIANLGLMTPLVALILLGVFRTLKRRDGRRAFAVAHLTLLANLVMVVIFWADSRFRDANMPVLALYGVAGLWWLRYRTDVFAATPVATGPAVC